LTGAKDSLKRDESVRLLGVKARWNELERDEKELAAELMDLADPKLKVDEVSELIEVVDELRALNEGRSSEVLGPGESGLTCSY
jgi:hypothetical protein